MTIDPTQIATVAAQADDNLRNAVSIVRAAISAGEELDTGPEILSFADSDTDGAYLKFAPPVTTAQRNTFARILTKSVLAQNDVRVAGEIVQGFEPLRMLAPSAGFNGTAGSGFGGSYGAVPADPTRTTAKPACRLMVPPNQYFTDQLLVGVYAGANNQGSLANLGLSKVRVHYEGSTYDILKPTWQTITDTNGNKRRYFGWWVWLKRNGVNGEARCYFEAVPADTTMQSRVMGPYSFFPATTLHDYDLTVAATGAIVAGVSYQTIPAAIAYLKSVSAKNPRITITQSGTYALGTGAAPDYQGNGYCNIRATVPVTIAGSLPYSSTSYFRTKWDGMRFYGSNITFDMAYVSQVYSESLGRQHWFDGIQFTNSLGRNSLWMGSGRPTAWLVLGAAYYTECTISGLSDVGKGNALIRGCTLTNGYKDCVTGGKCIVGNTTSDWNSDFFSGDTLALTVQYVGAGTTATLQVSGTNDANNRVFTARVDGVSVGTFTVQNTQAAFTANTNYTVQNVVTWLNSLSGWTATLLDNTRRATGIGPQGTRGGTMAQTSVKTPLTLATAFDYHSDWYQQGDTENVVIADNYAYGIRAQILFIAKNPAADFLVINNCFGGNGTAFGYSQLARAQSHVVIAHNSWYDQALRLRSDAGQDYTADGYCLIANNVMEHLAWMGAVDTDLVMTGNHVYSGFTSPAGATGTTIGGDRNSLFVSAVAGDFTPAGDLLTNLKTPVVKFDNRIVRRAATAPAGAVTA